jgi:glutamate-1-semialdehyde 2,1-aminomutase
MQRAGSSAPVVKHQATNEELLARAKQVIAGGDSSTMRVLPYHLPLVAERGEGSRVWDAEGREYIDLNMAYGPLMYGHRPQFLVDAVTQQVREHGSQLGFPTEISIRAAENVQRIFPSMELMRFANSGTEANASAVRVARAFTGRRKIILFEGHYHGWSEAVFTRYHAQLADLPECGYAPAIPGTRGIAGSIDDVIVVRWNNLEVLESCLARHRGEIAAVIMEPVMGNGGTIPPNEDYLRGVRYMTIESDILLIFDEVITGMRVALGGAQELYDVAPDLTIISKAIGGGYPVAAFGGRREIMDRIVTGEVFHGGVYSANATVMAAVEASTRHAIENRTAIYGHLNRISAELAAGLHGIMDRHGVPHLVQHVGPMLSLFLTREPVEKLCEYRDVRRMCEFEKFIQFQHAAQRLGVYFHPNQFEPMFPSTAHTSEEIGAALERLETAARETLVK